MKAATGCLRCRAANTSSWTCGVAVAGGDGQVAGHREFRVGRKEAAAAISGVMCGSLVRGFSCSKSEDQAQASALGSLGFSLFISH